MSLPAPGFTPDYTPDPYWDRPTESHFHDLGDLDPATAPAHETAAVLRMQRSGWKGPQIADYLGISSLSLVDQMSKALEGETIATQDLGQAIYDTSVKPPSADS